MKHIKLYESFVNSGYILDLTELEERLERTFFNEISGLPWEMVGSSMTEIKILPLTQLEENKLKEIIKKYPEVKYRERTK